MNNETKSDPVDPKRLLALVAFEYRSLVVRRLGVATEWRVLDWTGSAACRGQSNVTVNMCERCPVAGECLAAAIASDDPAEWRGGLSRADREELWTSVENAYREVRDLSMRKFGQDELPNDRTADRLGEVIGAS